MKMKITKSQERKFAAKLQLINVHGKYTQLQSQKGLYLFVENVFQLLYKGILIMELEHDFFEMTNLEDYSLRIKHLSGVYGFISETDLQ